MGAHHRCTSLLTKYAYSNNQLLRPQPTREFMMKTPSFDFLVSAVWLVFNCVLFSVLFSFPSLCISVAPAAVSNGRDSSSATASLASGKQEKSKKVERSPNCICNNTGLFLLHSSILHARHPLPSIFRDVPKKSNKRTNNNIEKSTSNRFFTGHSPQNATFTGL